MYRTSCAGLERVQEDISGWHDGCNSGTNIIHKWKYNKTLVISMKDIAGSANGI